MLFNTWQFIFLFLPIFLLAWQAVALLRPHLLIYVPLGASLIFYTFWSAPFLPLLLGLIAINLGFAQLFIWHKSAYPDNAKRLKRIFILAIILNLLPLIWFKYSFFLIQNFSLLFNIHCRFLPPDLPLGISFYTFIQIAWLMAIYRGEAAPGGIPEHVTFSCAFPYVIAGPIVRMRQMDWQLRALQPLKAAGLARGFTLFAIGLAKKAILADSMGIYADAVFNGAFKNLPVSGAEAWLGSFCYTFQLYFDFSGYTDMALGLGLMMGLRLPQNFNSPYKSTGIVDFWRRWHITLSSWLRDFLYIPLGGNRHGRLRQYVNLFLTMLMGGAWHGAGWTFIIWGALHGAMLCVNHFFRIIIKGSGAEPLLSTRPARLFFIFITFICINLCWVIFRSQDLNAALAMYQAMFIGAWDLPNNYFPHWQPFALIAASCFLCWFCPNSQEIIDGGSALLSWRPTRAWAATIAILVFFSLALMSRQATFLYFQF